MKQLICFSDSTRHTRLFIEHLTVDRSGMLSSRQSTGASSIASKFLPGILLHVLSFSDFQLEWVFFSVIFDHH